MGEFSALVTGASRGIGRRLVQDLSRRGSVIGTYRSTPPKDPNAVRWLALDVTDPASHQRLSTQLADIPLSLLVCNAGIYLDRGHTLAEGFDTKLWTDTFAANVTGVFLTVQALLPNLRAAEGAKIAIIASQMGSSNRAPGGSYIYRASKAAAINLGRNLATDLRAEGIAVGVYHPGWVQTDMGGAEAAITVEESSAGLIMRFDDLRLEITGCFETWDGRPHPL